MSPRKADDERDEPPDASAETRPAIVPWSQREPFSRSTRPEPATRDVWTGMKKKRRRKPFAGPPR